MRLTFLIVLSLLAALGSTQAMAQTQTGMNADACATERKADAQLNDVYRKVLAEHKGDAAFLAKIRDAQRAWLVFRDAELDAIYPAADKQAEYGSAFPMCHCLERTALVEQRIRQLSAWLKPAEGDVCRGSR